MVEILLVGHRGAAAYEPENTIRSFDAGIRMGANAIEFDTRLTKDRKLAVFHDKTLERTTNGKGNMRDYTLKELQKLDAGKGEQIPTAEEAVEFITKKGATALLEIKDRDAVSETAAVVKKFQNVMVHSFDTTAIKEFKQLAPEIPAALVISNKIKNLTGFFRLLKAIKAEWIFAEKEAAEKEFIEAAHKWKFKVEVWVCNTDEEVKKFVKLGADGIASDKPDLFGKY